MTATHTQPPAYASIKVACQVIGLSRSSLYRRLAAGDLRAIHVGRSLLIDMNHALAWLAAQPTAEFSPAPTRG